MIRNFKKRKVNSIFIEITWDADLADMQLKNKFNKGLRFLLCVIEIYSQYACVIHLKDKNRIKTTDAFQKVLDDSKREQNKIWFDKGSEFYNWSIKLLLEKTILKCIQRIMKINLLFLKDLWTPWKIKFINTWLQYKNMHTLIN